MNQENIVKYFEGIFQEQLEEALVLEKKPSDEETPYENKYQAREIYKSILNHEILKDESFKEVISLKGVLSFLLGSNCFETEENGTARQYYKTTLTYFEKQPYEDIKNFWNYIQEIFNSQGLLLVNSDVNEEGVGYLSKAFKIYDKIMDIIKETKTTYYNTLDEYDSKLNTVFNLDGDKTKIPKKYQEIDNLRPEFRYFYKGGLSIEKTEEIFTLTNFYFAQCYTKFGLKDDAAFYCGQTLKRQIDLDEFESKEWCNSSMGLAEYYKSDHQYSQAMYIVFIAQSILPVGKNNKTRASLNIMMGNIVNDYLDYNCTQILCGLNEKEKDDEEGFNQLITHINRESLSFKDMPVKFPVNKVHKDIDGVKSLFRMALTEYKKALQVYVMDGFVTDHVQIQKCISQLYKRLIRQEKEPTRVSAMLLKRIEAVKPIVETISPKAYVGLWRVYIFIFSLF